MTDRGWWQPSVNKAPHAVPEDASVLAAPRQRAMPEPPHQEAKSPQRRLIHGHTVIQAMPTNHRLEPGTLFRYGLVHALPQLGFHLVQLRLQPFADRLPQHREHPIASLLCKYAGPTGCRSVAPR